MALQPLIYTDGTEFFESLGQKYIRHERGLFILAPSGAGKTHFCKNQAEPHWIDGDELWIGAKAHPPTEWWTESLEVINQVDQRSDAITMEAKKLGFWVMGASNYWLEPNAVVIPDWETHKSFIEFREKNNYDGGAKSDALDQVRSHIEVIRRWHTNKQVPMFKSIPEAVSALTKI